MRFLLLVLLAGCSTLPPVDPDPTPGKDTLTNVGEKLDKADSRVSAAITVAKEIIPTTPAVAIKELDVALSYLPVPSEGDVAFARQRATLNDDKSYKVAIAYGNKLQADLVTMWTKMEYQQSKSEAEIKVLKDTIKTKDAEIQKAKDDIVTWGLVVLGGIAALASIAFAWTKQFTGAGAAGAVAVFAFAYPSLIDTQWFLPSLGGLILVGLLAGFALWRRSNTKTVV